MFQSILPVACTILHLTQQTDKFRTNTMYTSLNDCCLALFLHNLFYFTLSLLESLRTQISALSSDLPDWETLVGNALQAATAKSENNVSTKAQHGMKMIRINK